MSIMYKVFNDFFNDLIEYLKDSVEFRKISNVGTKLTFTVDGVNSDVVSIKFLEDKKEKTFSKLSISYINRKTGPIDTLEFEISKFLGLKSSNLSDGGTMYVYPHIYLNRPIGSNAEGYYDWFYIKPSSDDLNKIFEEIKKYIKLFIL